MTVNAEAPIAVIRAMAPLLSRSSLAGGAAVTAFGDIHAVGVPIAGYGGYLASKAAMQRGLRALALELAPRIRVNVIVAGLIARPPTMRDDELRDYLSRVPLARAGTPGDAAALVRFLTLEAPFMTGCAVTLDGGRSLHWPEPAAG
jgi:NAD(P)-dependent dehydrogenase (short-subunit alcohol dehydrogenase family)